MKRMLITAVAATVVLGAGSAPAAAAGPTLCVGGPSTPMLSPNADGECKKGYTLVTLAEQADVAALQARVSTLESDNTALKNRVSTLESDNTALKSRVSAAESDVTALAGRATALENKLSKVSYSPTGLNGQPTLRISGANLQIVDGSGNTGGSTNGLGNLFLGYGEQQVEDVQTGSHNIVLGIFQSFSSYGGLVAGSDNNVSGASSSVFGTGNTASGFVSSVSGGRDNVASGTYSAVSGGHTNTASGQDAAISGGQFNLASGAFSSISGGALNTAASYTSSILGGRDVVLNSTNYQTSP